MTKSSVRTSRDKEDEESSGGGGDVSDWGGFVSMSMSVLVFVLAMTLSVQTVVEERARPFRSLQCFKSESSAVKFGKTQECRRM